METRPNPNLSKPSYMDSEDSDVQLPLPRVSTTTRGNRQGGLQSQSESSSGAVTRNSRSFEARKRRHKNEMQRRKRVAVSREPKKVPLTSAERCRRYRQRKKLERARVTGTNNAPGTLIV